MKHPDQDSKRSKRRANRGFKSLEQSSRKHKRNVRRQGEKQTFAGKRHEAGVKDFCSGGGRTEWLYTSGGANRYH